jgi:hypothetical protein
MEERQDANPKLVSLAKIIEDFENPKLLEEKPLFRKAKGTNNLIAVHNISESNLRKVLEMGGLIMPSIAITDVDMGHSGHGEISLPYTLFLLSDGLIVYLSNSGDAWTPRIPKMESKLNGEIVRSVRKKIEGLLDENLRGKYCLSAELHPSNIESTISNNGKLIQAFHSLMQVLCSCSLTKLQIGGKRNLHGGMKILTAFMNH